MKIVSNLCHKYHVTATMTNILCGGGVGTLVGSMIHISGLPHVLRLLTGIIRCAIRWRVLAFPVGASPKISLSTIPVLLSYGLIKWVLPVLSYIQDWWLHLASHPSLSNLFHEYDPGLSCTEHLPDSPVPIGLGFLYGCIFVYGSKIGWYHSLFLPLILIEMDGASRGEEASLLGAIDECTLVIVCAGICSGNLILPFKQKNDNMEGNRGSGHASLSWQALKTNIFCGDFIEAAYPSMERSSVINVSSYIAGGLSTEVLMKRSVLSTAYIPLPIAIWISNDRIGMGLACTIAYVVSFCGTIIANAISHR